MTQVFAVELSSPQRIRFSMSNLCGLQQIRCLLPQLRCSHQIRFLLLNSVNRNDSRFCCQIVLTAAIQVFTAQICVVCGEIVLSVVNKVFAAECVGRGESGFRCWIFVVRSESCVCYPIVCSHWIRFSLLNSLTAALQVFAAQCVFAVNYMFTAKLCCPQRI